MGKNRARYLTELAVLSAVIIIMAFTPLGYLRIGVMEITFITVPIVVGAVFLGPRSGALLGVIFGLTSFAQCFGMNAMGTLFMSVSPVRTFLMCVVPRALMGLLVGLIYRALSGGKLAYPVAALAGPALNTLLYMPATFFLFQQEWLDAATATMGYTGTEGGMVLFGFLMATIAVNAVVEALVGLVLSTALCKALSKGIRR